MSVLGLHPVRDRDTLTERMGTQLQEATMIPRLTVTEALRTFALFYAHSRDLGDLLAELGLSAKAGSRVERLWGGQRQRVFIALALLHDPELLFFDELTSALDPQVRLTIWAILRRLKEEGRTIMLTTHSMEEAEALCDRIAIIDAGRIVAEGTPADLIATHAGGSVLKVRTDRPVPDEILLAVDGVTAVDHATAEGATCPAGLAGSDIAITGRGQFASQAMSVLAAQGVTLTDMSLKEATLEDVFLALTGRRMRDGE